MKNNFWTKKYHPKTSSSLKVFLKNGFALVKKQSILHISGTYISVISYIHIGHSYILATYWVSDILHLSNQYYWVYIGYLYIGDISGIYTYWVSDIYN